MAVDLKQYTMSVASGSNVDFMQGLLDEEKYSIAGERSLSKTRMKILKFEQYTSSTLCLQTFPKLCGNSEEERERGVVRRLQQVS